MWCAMLITYIHTYNRLLYSAISDDHSAQNKIKYTTKTSRIQVNKQNALNFRKQIGFQLFFEHRQRVGGAD